MKTLLVPLALGGLLACAPNLLGAPCTSDCSCPNAQTCFPEADGGGSCQTGPNQCNPDAGPSLGGRLTLNGGAPKPSQNTAYVYAWDHVPSFDGGLELPQHSIQTNANGSFLLYGVEAGKTYHVVGEYDLPLASGGKRFTELAGGVVAPNDLIRLDVQTTQCLSLTSHLVSLDGVSQEGTAPDPLVVAALVADIPDIVSGAELQPSVVASAVATGPDGGSYGLTLQTQSTDPLIQGKWAWLSPLGNVSSSGPGAFHFTITSSNGQYPKGSCAFNFGERPNGPTDLGINNSGPGSSHDWRRGAASSAPDIVDWTSAPGSQIDLLTIAGPDGHIYYPTSNDPGDTPPKSLPGNTIPPTGASPCPSALGTGTASCRASVTSFWINAQIQGVSFEGATAIQDFVTTDLN